MRKVFIARSHILSMKCLLGLILISALLLSVGAVYAECTDSDGDNPEVSGTVTYTRFWLFKSLKADTCKQDKLLEYYCEKNHLWKKQYVCTHGCSDGACVSSQTEQVQKEGQIFEQMLKREPEKQEESKPCIAEGKMGMRLAKEECCMELVSISDSKYEIDRGSCTPPGSNGFVCTTCGNSICSEGENQCNCPKDCPQQEVTADACITMFNSKNIKIGQDFVAGEIIVGFPRGTTRDEAKDIMASYNLELREWDELITFTTVGVSAGSEIEWVCKLRGDPRISYAELNVIFRPV